MDKENELLKESEKVLNSVNVYCVYDRTAGRAIVTFQSENDGLAVRENAPSLSKALPIGDLELYKIATLDVKARFIRPLDSWILIPWDSYQFPENPFVVKK